MRAVVVATAGVRGAVAVAAGEVAASAVEAAAIQGSRQYVVSGTAQYVITT